MGSPLLELVIKQYEQSTRLVSMNDAIEQWLERQEGRLHGKQAPRRRSHQQSDQQDANRRT